MKLFRDLVCRWMTVITFTTGEVTQELVDIRRGFDGEGPLGWLDAVIQGHPER